ncbi:MAG: 30S ribosomal protein S13 [Methanoregula sp.]|jgi:small subunit ribosomal protein S13
MAQEEEIRYYVRVGTTDLDGTKSVRVALTGIKGIGRHTSTIISRMAKVDEYAKLGLLDEESVNRIRAAVEKYAASIPAWMANRPKDVYTGEDKHLIGTDVTLTRDEDVNMMRKIRCYRGIRHETGQKVRGQRTKSTGRTGITVGVSKKREGTQGAAN